MPPHRPLSPSPSLPISPSSPHPRYTLHRGHNLPLLRAMESNSIDAVVTDPPYGISFMGNRWDYKVPSTEIWAECLRVLKPGGHLLSFAGTRTHHRLVIRIEDAGFEIRDMIAWVYGQGFPKSHNLDGDRQGLGTALKPALEPITLARKPLLGTVAQNVASTGCGALNIDACRVAADTGDYDHPGNDRDVPSNFFRGLAKNNQQKPHQLGRWPANLIHDGSPEVLAGFPHTQSNSGNLKARAGVQGEAFGKYAPGPTTGITDSGSAARFFYCAKASKADRDEGLEALPTVDRSNGNKWTDQDYRVQKGERSATRQSGPRRNKHPTVKPTSLMRYLCRLITPPGGLILDPFMGSGSTGKAALLEGFRFIGIDLDEDKHGNPAGYLQIAHARLAHAAAQGAPA